MHHLLGYVSRESKLLVVIRKKCRSEILANRNFSVALARKLLGDRNPFEVDEQDFVSHIIVGSQDMSLVVPGMLRYIIKREIRRASGVLHNAAAIPGEDNQGNAAAAVLSFFQGIYCPACRRLAAEVFSIHPDDITKVAVHLKRYIGARPDTTNLQSGQTTTGPPDLTSNRKAVSSATNNRFYKVRSSIPFRPLTRDEIGSLNINEFNRLVTDLPLNTSEQRMQACLLRGRLDYFLSQIKDQAAFNLFDALTIIINLAPYIVEQIPDDDYSNIFLARDGGLLYMVKEFLGRLSGRDNFNDHAFVATRKELGKDIYHRLVRMVDRAYAAKPESLARLIEITMPVFKEMMQEEEFSGVSRRMYQRLKDAGTIKGNKFRVIDVWAAGRLTLYIILLIEYFREGNTEYSYEQFIVAPKKAVAQRHCARLFDFTQTGLSEEIARGWCAGKVLSSDLSGPNFTQGMSRLAAQIVSEHYPYGELNLGHRIDWDPLKRRLVYASPAKQLGAFLREVAVVNSVMDYMSRRGVEQVLEVSIDEVIAAEPRTINVQIADIFRDFCVELTAGEGDVFARWVEFNNEHYITEADANQRNVLLNTAYLIKAAGGDIAGRILARQKSDKAYSLQIQRLIYCIKRIPAYSFPTLLRSILSSTGEESSGLGLLECSPTEIANLLNEANLGYERESLSMDEYLLAARSVAGIEDMIKHGEFDELIKSTDARLNSEVARASDAIAGLPNRSAVLLFGPSAAGKEYATMQLIAELRQRGRSVLRLNLDPYFKSAEELPLVGGKHNFDTPEAVDWERALSDIRGLCSGRRVSIPLSKSKAAAPKEVIMTDLLLIEGVFAYDSRISDLFKDSQIAQLKVGVVCIPDLELAAGRCLVSSDIRELRRIYRDSIMKEHGKKRTPGRVMRRFIGVRKSERAFVLPELDGADLIINTFMPYNLCMLKNNLGGRITVEDGALEDEAGRLNGILAAVPDLNQHISKWRSSAASATRYLDHHKGLSINLSHPVKIFGKAEEIKTALFCNPHNCTLLSDLQEAVKQNGTLTQIISALVLIDIGDNEIVDIDQRLNLLKILVGAVNSGYLAKDNSLKGRIDLHTHSYYSDGVCSATGLIFKAWIKGMRAIAVTDHNTFEHMNEIMTAWQIIQDSGDSEFEVIPGIEINVVNTGYDMDGGDHMLCYFPIAEGIKGRENIPQFLEWLKGVSAHPFVKHIGRYQEWARNTTLDLLRTLESIHVNKSPDIGINPVFLDLKDSDFIQLRERHFSNYLVLGALHRKFGLDIDLLNDALDKLRKKNRDVAENAGLREIGYE
ncbi:MAG: PHP domain-containing protein, partial [Candidatus Omnitrophica bacterium]|nr:PHP domain-containing protein [Candidatus Omnitrophota bacterium]